MIHESEVQYPKLEIAKGGFGRVFPALWRGEEVILKISEPKNEIDEKTFRYEVNLLSQLSHPNIVAFRGIVLLSPLGHVNRMAILLERADQKSLRQFFESEAKLPADLTLSFITDILAGLNYLAESNTLHLDLKADNVLCFSNNIADAKFPTICKLCDFGLSRQVKTSALVSAIGTAGYAAPEMYSSKATPAADIFSLAMLFLEILTRSPLPVFPIMEMARTFTLENGRPNIPEWMPTFWLELITQMWRHDPLFRPSLATVTRRVRALNGIAGFAFDDDTLAAKRRSFKQPVSDIVMRQNLL